MKTPAWVRSHPWGWILAYWVLAYLGHVVGLAFLQTSSVTLFFFPAGFTLTFLLIFGPKYLWVAILPHLLRGLNTSLPNSFIPSLVLGLLHAHAYGLMAYLLRSVFRIDLRLKSLRDVGWLIALAATIPLFSGWGAMAFLESEGILRPGRTTVNALQFWLGDLSATLAFTPLLLQWVVPALRGTPRPLPRELSRTEVSEMMVQTGLLVAIPQLWSLFGPDRGWAFLHLAFLPFLWIGLRQGLPGVTLTLPFGTLMIAVYAPHSPLAQRSHPHDVSFFLVALAAASLMLGAAFSERLRAQRGERRQTHRLRQLLDGTPITIAVHQRGIFTYVNEAGARLLGFKGPEAVVGTPIRAIIHPESLELAASRIRQAEATPGPIGSAEERLQRVDGGTVDVEMHTTGFLDEGIPTIQVVAVDITRRKEAERQLQSLLREKEFLLREVQHRVKNNLQVMASLLNLQAGHAQEPETQKALQETQDRLKTLSLIHQRLEPSVRPLPVDLAQFLEPLAQRLTRSYTLRPGQVELDLRMAPLTMSVETATRLGMLLNELLSNCFKHAFPQGRQGRVEVRLWQEEREVHLVVADDGPGTPEGFNLSTPSTLGFQILLALTEQLRGALTLDRGPGCAFHLRFPPEAP